MKSDAYIIVTCDSCRTSLEIELTALASRGWDDRNVNTELAREGWECAEGRDICPECREE